MNSVKVLKNKIDKLVYTLENEKLSPADRQKTNDQIASLKREIEDVSRKEPMIISHKEASKVKERTNLSSSRLKDNKNSRVVVNISNL